MPTYTISPKGCIVTVRTPDDLELDGFLVEPTRGSADTAVLYIHGMFENFHLPLFVDPLATRIAESGATFASINTRARDYTYYFRKWEDESFTWDLWGGSYEIFNRCLLDIDSWMRFFSEIGKRKVILMGHSHGALKAPFYAANHTTDTRISALILLSPSDDIGIQKKELTDRYDDALTVAKWQINEGKGRELLSANLYSQPITAEMYVDMFRPDSDIAIFPFTDPATHNGTAAQISQPTFVIFGANDVATAGIESSAALEICRTLLSSVEHFDGRVIADTEHHYLGKEDEMVDAVVTWIESRKLV